MQLKIYQIDAFTSRVFKGNPAAVIILDNWLDDDTMQKIASENNLSETAFIVKNSEIYDIRWFSPLCEIDFCGHATLASAYILFEQLDIKELIFFAKAVGKLKINLLDDGYIQMRFPNKKPKRVETIPEELKKGLSIFSDDIFVNEQAYFIIYENEKDVYDVSIDEKEIKKLKPLDVTVSAKSKEYDFISRYFWPANGGYEDFVTGSMHTGLAPLWSQRLNKNELMAYQASSRGGILKCIVKDNEVIILGKAIKYLEGIIHI